MSIAALKPMNEAERARRARCVAFGCVACLMFGADRACGLVEYHHLLVAGERAGHRFGVALGKWHHQGDLIPGYTMETMVVAFGPSLKHHAIRFHVIFGSDQRLLDYEDNLIGAPLVILPTRRRSRGSAASPSNIFPRGGFR